MIELKFAISLPCPLNQLYCPFIGKGMRWPRTIMSSKGRKHKQQVVGELLMQLQHAGAKPVISKQCTMDYMITFPDRRARDIDCYEKQLLDSLQAAGVIANDKLIVQISKQSHPVPSRPGGITMTITELPL